MKTCNKCLVEKPLESFYSQKVGKLGRESICKACKNKNTNVYRKAHPELGREQARKWRMRNKNRHLNNVLMNKFGITVEQYEKLYKDQNGSCGICKEVKLDGRRLCVDHNHTTGEIRGLLCDDCNRGIGFLKDSLENLRNAFDYIEGNSSIIRS